MADRTNLLYIFFLCQILWDERTLHRLIFCLDLIPSYTCVIFEPYIVYQRSTQVRYYPCICQPYIFLSCLDYSILLKARPNEMFSLHRKTLSTSHEGLSKNKLHSKMIVPYVLNYNGNIQLYAYYTKMISKDCKMLILRSI